MSKYEPHTVTLSERQAQVLESVLEQAMDEYLRDVADGGEKDDAYVRALADVLVKVENAQGDKCKDLSQSLDKPSKW